MFWTKSKTLTWKAAKFWPMHLWNIAHRYSRACFVNSSSSSSLSLFFGMLPTNSRWLLKDIVTPSFLPFLSSKSFNWKRRKEFIWKFRHTCTVVVGLGDCVQCATVLVIFSDQSNIRKGTCYSTELILATPIRDRLLKAMFLLSQFPS